MTPLPPTAPVPTERMQNSMTKYSKEPQHTFAANPRPRTAPQLYLAVDREV